MELTENTWLGRFDVLWQAKVTLGGYGCGSRRKNATRGTKTMVVGVYSTVLGSPKWKSQFRRLELGDLDVRANRTIAPRWLSIRRRPRCFFHGADHFDECLV